MSEPTENQLQSPCVGICALNMDRVCVGCGRTNNEIAQWISMPMDERKNCLQASSERLAEMLPKP